MRIRQVSEARVLPANVYSWSEGKDAWHCEGCGRELLDKPKMGNFRQTYILVTDAVD